jgi:hypothetical protein
MRRISFSIIVGLLACSRAPEPVAASKSPIIGTRAEQDGPLTPTREIEAGHHEYIGCDFDPRNLERGGDITATWLYTPARRENPVQVLHRVWYRADRREMIRVWVDQAIGSPPGTYECLFSNSMGGVSAQLRAR